MKGGRDRANLTVVGGTDTESTWVVDAGSTTFVPTGIFDSDGNHYFKGQQTSHPGNRSSGHGSGDGSGSGRGTLTDLRLNVAMLNGAALLFIGSLGAMFLWLVDRIDDKFEILQTPVQSTAQVVSAQGVTLQTIERKVDALDQGRNKEQVPQNVIDPGSKKGS